MARCLRPDLCGQAFAAKPSPARCLRPRVVRKVDDDGPCGAAHDNPSKRLQFRGVDLHMQQEGGDMNEVASLRVCGIFSSCAPAYFAAPGEDVCDRLLLSMMMNSCPRTWFHLEQTAPDGRSDAQCWRDRRATFGAGRLCGSGIELDRADDVDCGRYTHGVQDHF